jgi:hypothetical protein
MPGELPLQFQYLSQRILGELHNALEARRPNWRMDSVQLGGKIVPMSGTYKRSPGNDASLELMAQRVTAGVSDQTGSVLYPGNFIRVEMPMVWGVMNWKVPDDELAADPRQNIRSDVAWLYGEAQSNEGLVALVLLGSTDNFLEYSAPPRESPAWRASSFTGALSMLQRLATCSVARVNDSIVVTQGVDDVFAPHGDHTSEAKLMERMIDLSRETAKWAEGNAVLDMLIGTFYSFDNFSIQRRDRHGRRFDEEFRAVVYGTPIWAGFPSPKRDQRVVRF